MTGSSRPNPPIEELLDQLLDDLSPGKSSSIDDPELADFALLAAAIQADDNVEWPGDAYPSRLADELCAGLETSTGVASNGYIPAAQWDDEASPEGRPGFETLPEAAVPDLTGDHRSWLRPRSMLGIAAAIAGFGLLTLVLVAVFRGFDDENAPAIGGSEDDHPPQLAVTMQTDPVNGNPDIFLVSLDGSEPVNLTNHPANDTMPAWSPDGTRIAFISDRSGEDAIYVMEADGSYPRELDPFRNHPESNPNADWHYRNLAWSPDGSAIAVMRYPRDPESDAAQILIVDAGGAGLRIGGVYPAYPQLTFDQTPVWSPDSQWLVFEIRNQDESRLAVTGRGAGYRTPPHLLPDSVSGTGPSWSVDNEIAVATGDGVAIVEFTGEFPYLVSDEIRRLSIPDSNSATSVTWSPDGSHLALMLDAANGSGIWITDVSGQNLTELPDSNFSLYPVWSPDGTQLAFLRFGAFFSAESTGHDLMLYDTESGSLTKVLDTGFSGPLMSPPAWRPNTDSSDATPTPEPAPENTPTAPPAVATATASANYQLIPPQANMRIGSSGVEIEGQLGSYSWQFNDADQTTGSVVYRHLPRLIDVPQVGLNATVSILVHGEEYSRPPESAVMEIHRVDIEPVQPTAPPLDGSGTSSYRITMQEEPFTTISAADPANPEFALDVPAGNYVLFVKASWGQHPVTGREVFVTWVFDIQVGRDAMDSIVTGAQRAISMMREFLDEPDAILSVDQVHESSGRTFVNLSRPIPGMEEQAQYADQFYVDVTDETVFGADLYSSTTLAQPRNPVDEESARAIAEDFFERKNALPGEFEPVTEEVLALTDDVLNVTWGVQSDGVWLPTTVEVGVDLETGLVVRYIARDFPYNGPWEAEISEADARQIAGDILASDPELAGATIDSVRLAATFSNFANDVVDGRVVLDMEAQWRLAWEFELVDRPNPESDHYIWIDAATGQRLVTGVQQSIGIRGD